MSRFRRCALPYLLWVNRGVLAVQVAGTRSALAGQEPIMTFERIATHQVARADAELTQTICGRPRGRRPRSRPRCTCQRQRFAMHLWQRPVPGPCGHSRRCTRPGYEGRLVTAHQRFSHGKMPACIVGLPVCAHHMPPCPGYFAGSLLGTPQDPFSPARTAKLRSQICMAAVRTRGGSHLHLRWNAPHQTLGASMCEMGVHQLGCARLESGGGHDSGVYELNLSMSLTVRNTWPTHVGRSARLPARRDTSWPSSGSGKA